MKYQIQIFSIEQFFTMQNEASQSKVLFTFDNVFVNYNIYLVFTSCGKRTSIFIVSKLRFFSKSNNLSKIKKKVNEKKYAT